jgi:hypothetical protein
MRKLQSTLALILCLTLLSSCSIRKTETSTTAATSSESAATTSTAAAQENPATAETVLYPASAYVDGVEKWGFIDRTGQFVIKPSLELAFDFQPVGLAKFSKDNLVGLINTKGETVVQPIYNDIGEFADDLAIARNWGQTTTSTLLDTSGKVLFQKDFYFSDFSEGLAAAYVQDAKSGGGKYGYVDLTGEFAVKAQYDSAGDFTDGKALVSTTDGQQFYIDHAGKKVADDQMPESGSQLLYDKVFDDGIKIVGRQADYKEYYGLFSKTGTAIIKDDYAGIERLSDNLFVAAKESGEIFWYSGLPKALFDKTGKQLTDFVFYDVNDANDGYFSVSDLQSTYLVDANGQVYTKLPKIQGNGTLSITHGLIKASIDQQLSYYTLDGQLVYDEDQSYQLDNGLQVTRQKYSPDRFQLAFYPEVSGLADKSVQSAINATLMDAFTSEAQFLNFDGSKIQPGTAYITVDFTAEINQDLLVIHKSGYLYPVGAAHGQPTSQYFHFNVKTGKTFALKDLFKPGVDYKTTLEKLISQQIQQQEEKGEAIYDNKNPTLTEANFLIGRDHLEIFYSPYEIASYAAGFPTFSIAFSDISDLIATDGELWNAFAK